MVERNNTLAIVAHDAGVANHIWSWIQMGSLNVDNINLCVAGPAIKIFNNIFPKYKNGTLEMVIKRSNLLISGTGWASALEYDARVLAKKNNIRSIAVIDHWGNYRERFIRDSKEVLPDEIWVVDEYALDMARQAFPGMEISLQSNDYMKLQLQEIEKHSKETSSYVNILYLMEPIRQKWGICDISGEIQSLEYFIARMGSLNLGKDFNILIKPHPSDAQGKYENWVKKHNDLPLQVEENLSLSELIAWSDVVVGCHTYAMVIAVAAGKKVISAIPPIVKNKFILPQKEIIHL